MKNAAAKLGCQALAEQSASGVSGQDARPRSPCARSTAVVDLGLRAQARATHGAWHGTWYFEVRVAHLGATGHCRLGWSTRKGELQGPVGYDMFRRAACRMYHCESMHGDSHACVLQRAGSSGCRPPGMRCALARSYGYRDVDGSKVHCALRESYGAAWAEVGTPRRLARSFCCELQACAATAVAAHRWLQH